MRSFWHKTFFFLTDLKILLLASFQLADTCPKYIVWEIKVNCQWILASESIELKKTAILINDQIPPKLLEDITVIRSQAANALLCFHEPFALS